MKSITYHGGYFTTSDVLLLKPPGWLNDSCILHLFLRMKHEILGDSPSVLLMDPSVISFLRLQCDTEEEMKELAEGLALRERNALLVPVNDMESFSGSSTHWSLLCGIRRNRLNEKRIRNSPEWYFLHFDSHSGANDRHAESLAAKLYPLDDDLNFNNHPNPSNTYDCGMYVVECARWLLNHSTIGVGDLDLLEVDPTKIGQLMSSVVTPEWISSARSEAQRNAHALLSES